MSHICFILGEKRQQKVQRGKKTKTKNLRVSVFLLHSNASTLRGKTMEQKHHELWSKKRAAQALRQTVRATRIIPAFSSSRFLAASALCCRIRAKRSARAILSETTKYLKKKNCSSKVSNKLINYRRE